VAGRLGNSHRFPLPAGGCIWIARAILPSSIFEAPVSVQSHSHAFLSIVIGIAAPILSSACAHDSQRGSQGHTRSESASAEPQRTDPRHAYPYQIEPLHIRPGAVGPSTSTTIRSRGPTYVEAIFESRNSAVGPPFRERYHGFAAVAPDGRSNIEIQNIGKTIRCSGRSRVTRPPTGPGATGLRGEAFISCSDGRYATADYRYVTNTRGEGQGQDYLGNRFTILFMVVP